MFEQMLLPTGDTHQGRDAVLAFAGQLTILAIATLLMAYFDVAPMSPLPEAAVPLYFFPPAPPPPPVGATHAPIQTAVSRFVPRTFNMPTAPVTVPQHAAIIADAAPALQDLTGTGGTLAGVPGGVPGGAPGGSLNGELGAPPAPSVATAAPEPAPAAPTQIRVGGEVEAARLLREVMPVYPIIARDARVQGTVKLSAAIAPNGTVQDLHVLSGSPLLTGAAQNAVKQWTYRPTYLNGKPVEVLTEIDVKFTLG